MSKYTTKTGGNEGWLSIERAAKCLSRSAFSLVGILVAGTVSVQAAPIIDTFENTSMLGASLGSTVFDISSGNLVTTPAETSPGTYGVLGGQAIFFWSMNGGRYSGFSVANADEQNVLQLTGIQNVTPPGKTDAFLYGYIYLFNSEPITTSYFDVNPVDGSWSINVYDVAVAALGTVPNDLRWSVEFYTASGGQEGVGYQYESFAAVPEPSTVAMLLGVGGLVVVRMLRKNLKRNVSI